jgi:hypothetical protein
VRIWPGQLSVMTGCPRSRLPVEDARPLGIDQCRLHAEERAVAEPGFSGRRAGQRRDQVAAGLGLPPGVDDGAAALRRRRVIPFPGFRVDRLAHRAEQAQDLREVAFTGSSPAPISERMAVGAV